MIGVAGCLRLGLGLLTNLRAAGVDEIAFAPDGYSDDNSIGILVKDAASALGIAPESDADLPLALQAAVRMLMPRSKA